MSISRTAAGGLWVGPVERLALDALWTDDMPHIMPLSDQQVLGHGLIRDVFGQPGLLITVDLPRTNYAQGQTTITYFLAVLVVVGIVTLVTILVLLQRIVLRRLSRLSSEVAAIGSSSDLL